MLMRPTTELLLDDLGLAKGHVVLDIGCGPGDVSLLAAARVGRGGRVIGVDLGPAAVDAARRRADGAHLSQTEFQVGSENELEACPACDLVIGRLVLIHQRDPVAFLQKLAAKVRPGGILAFHEHAGLAPPPSRPPLSLYDEVLLTITNCFQSAFAQPYAALEMSDLFRRAGLGLPSMRSAYPVIADAGSPVFDWAALCLKSFAAMGVLRRVPDLKHLADRMRTEFAIAHAQAFGMLELSAWVRVE